MLETRSLCAGYNGRDVLHDVNVSFCSSMITAITGPNGCGKSTLLKSITGMASVSSGGVLLDGVDTAGMSPQEIAQKIAYLPQNRQTPDITALRLVLHGRFPYLSFPRRYSKNDIAIARDAMAQMGISDLQEAPMASLSGGTRQKVYIAMALAQNAPIVLMDEPTTFLDISHQLQMMEHARFLAAQGKTIVMVLHDVALALKYADSLIAMERGRVVMQAAPDEMYESHCLDRILGVTISKIDAGDGPQYFCTASKER